MKISLLKNKLHSLRAGEIIHLTGIIYTARDLAHLKLIQLLETKEKLPFELKDAIIYYVGPTPTKPDTVIGSAGPTSSYRMDVFLKTLFEHGLLATIGKGPRSKDAKKLHVKYQKIYFTAVGGIGALLSKNIKKADVIAFSELGTEAIRVLEVENFPVTVAYDVLGNDIFEQNE